MKLEKVLMNACGPREKSCEGVETCTTRRDLAQGKERELSCSILAIGSPALECSPSRRLRQSVSKTARRHHTLRIRPGGHFRSSTRWRPTHHLRSNCSGRPRLSRSRRRFRTRPSCRCRNIGRTRPARRPARGQRLNSQMQKPGVPTSDYFAVAPDQQTKVDEWHPHRRSTSR